MKQYKNKHNIPNTVIAVDLVMKESIYGYSGNKKIPFIKVTMALQELIAPAKRHLERGEVQLPSDITNTSWIPYETNIDFEVR